MATSEPRRWAALRAEFEAIVDLPPHERAARLASLEAEDAAFAAELGKLLGFDRRFESGDAVTRSLDGAVCSLIEEFVHEGQAGAPAWIGGYRIVGTLGTGGMGVVYLAEQQSPRRTVALKVIRSHGGAGAVRRFQREAELLGRLQHANIAQIHEAGLARERDEHGVERGAPRPYFAMEYVRGEPIVDYARRRALPNADRLELVARACDAIEHAHGRGVIHRDLKSANILVDERGEPKVLDFGIARALDRDHAATVETAVGEVIGTLPYMSPEQVEGRTGDVGVRSDVYALGVVLFEVLTGVRPIDLGGRTLPEAVRLIVEEEPTRLGSFDRALRGDLETIVARCLEKEPARRYASAGALAADLRRVLRHEPIEARPASTLYQLGKFARRHRPLVAGVATAFVALVLGVIIATTMAVRAERARILAEAAEARAGEALADSERARKEAQRMSERLAEQLRYARIENSRSVHSFAFLNDLLTAADPVAGGRPDMTVREFVELAAEALHGDAGEDGHVKSMVGQIIATTLEHLGDREGAERAHRRTIELAGLPDPNAMGPESTRYASMMALAKLLRARGAVDEAAALYRRILEEREQTIAGRGDAVPPGQTRTADVYRSTALGDLAHLEFDRGRHDVAESLAKQASAMEMELVPMRPERRRAAALTLSTAAHAQKALGRHVEAIETLERAIRLGEEGDPPSHPVPLRMRGAIASILNGAGRHGEAAEVMRTALEILTPADGAAAGSGAPGGAAESVWALSYLASSLYLQGSALEARDASERAVAAAREHGADPAAEQSALYFLAASRMATGDAPGAERAFDEIVALVERHFAAEPRHRVVILAYRAHLARLQRRLDEARALALRAIELRSKTGLPRDLSHFMAEREAACALAASDDPATARQGAEELASVLAELRATIGDDHALVGRILVHRAEALRTAGCLADAAEAADAAAAILGRPGRVVAWWPRYAALLAEAARSPDAARGAAWERRVADVREAIVTVAGPASPELARLERLR